MTIQIYLPIFLILSLPLLLWVLPKPPFKISSPGLRFKIGSLLMLCIWTFAKVVFSSSIDIYHYIAGFLFICACLLFAFMVWSVVCWGYTICMLLSLSEHNQLVDSKTWQTLHAGPRGMHQLTENRIQVLINMHLAKIDGDQMRISQAGFYLAKFAQVLMKIFGVKT